MKEVIKRHYDYSKKVFDANAWYAWIVGSRPKYEKNRYATNHLKKNYILKIIEKIRGLLE